MREVNGITVVEDLLVREGLVAPNEVWVHGMWTPGKWVACLRARLRGRKLVRMPHGSLSPIYLTRQSPLKKRLVAPLERFLFRLADRVVVTGAHEEAWCRAWGVKGRFELLDLKRFFSFRPVAWGRHVPLRVLYIGRRHPLKGVTELEAAVKVSAMELRVETACFGAEKEAALDWCDLLVLPTLSENFGLVVAEALQHGKPVLTTDGAPAWENQPGVVYLKGYVTAAPEKRVTMLREALERMMRVADGKEFT